MKILTLIFIVCNFLTNVIAGDYDKEEIIKRCTSLGNELGISMNARDWESYKGITMWGIKNCKNTYSREDYYILYSYLSIVERENGRYSKAIEFAKECITNSYGIPACHVELAASSIQLNGKKGSIEYISQAKIVLKNAIAESKDSIKTTNHVLQKNLLQAQLASYDSMLEYIEAIGN